MPSRTRRLRVASARGVTMVRNLPSQDLCRELRLRMIRETEDYLNECLRHPGRTVRIPTVVVGHGVFAPRFAQAFWNQVLGLSPATESFLSRFMRNRFGL